MAKIIQILQYHSEYGHPDSSLLGLGDDGVVYQCKGGAWIEDIPALSRKKADKSVTLTGQAPVKRFQPPSVFMVKSYMLEKQTDERVAENESVKFFAYYDSNGWMVGKNKMKNWKSAATGWLSRNKPAAGIDSDSTDWYQDVGGML